jgi:hypothetical protein
MYYTYYVPVMSLLYVLFFLLFFLLFSLYYFSYYITIISIISSIIFDYVRGSHPNQQKLADANSRPMR